MQKEKRAPTEKRGTTKEGLQGAAEKKEVKRRGIRRAAKER